jgi:hypothetical protein
MLTFSGEEELRRGNAHVRHVLRARQPDERIGDNAWTQGWTVLGQDIPRPRAVLCGSPTGTYPAPWLSATQRPRTIHNVGGFSPSRPVQPFAELRTPPIGFPETLSEEHGSPRDFAGQRSLPATHLEH